MTWGQRCKAIGVMAAVAAGMTLAAASAAGVVPVLPPQVVEGFVGLLAITKAAAAAAGAFAYVTGRS